MALTLTPNPSPNPNPNPNPKQDLASWHLDDGSAATQEGEGGEGGEGGAAWHALNTALRGQTRAEHS